VSDGTGLLFGCASARAGGDGHDRHIL